MSRVAGRPLDVVEIDGDIVRRARTAAERRLSQETLARRVGVSSSLIGHVETGYTRRVNRQIAESIAVELDVPVETIIRSGPDESVQASLHRISTMLERLVGVSQTGGQDAGIKASHPDLALWATEFMRENSRRAPSNRPAAPPEDVARLAWHRKVGVGFDLTALPDRVKTRTDAELFHGWTEVARAIIEALRAGTAQPPPGPNQTVLFTYQCLDLFAVVEPQLRTDLLDTLRAALDNGWNVLHLVRYSVLARRYLAITSQAVELAGRKGRYVAKYVADDPDASTEFDLLVIPGHCTMQLWSTEPGSPPQAALKLSDPAIQRQMAAVFHKSEAGALRLMDTYPQYTALLRVLNHPAQVPGDRYEIKPGPALATVPKDMWRWAARQVRQPLEDGSGQQQALDLVDQYERAMIKRAHLLDTSLSSYATRGLMTFEALEDLADGIYDSNDWLIVRAQQMQADGQVPVRFRIQHLERIIDLLDGHDRFHLGIADARLMDESFPRNLLTVRIGAVAKDSAAFVQVWPESLSPGREDGFFAAFREPCIVHAFYDYFDDLWTGPGVVNDRRAVREILRQKVTALKELPRDAENRRRKRL